jgi:hypothetical protein
MNAQQTLPFKGPAPIIMVGNLHLHHVFSTPQDPDQHLSLLLVFNGSTFKDPSG